ncbi:MAG: hypothetical protein RL015_983 [Verrucomicrobiota bacterium]|jgi:hypothetical protein
MSFSFPSYRGLCRYLGETDALVELTELACRSFQDSAKSSPDVAAFVEAASVRFGIRVNLAEVDLLSRHLAKNYIVTVYQSAECFLSQFRKEHRALYQKEWVGDRDDIDPLSLTLMNLHTPLPENLIGQDLISRFQYYRIIRNWTVHTKDSDLSKPQARFAEIVPYKAERLSLESPLPQCNPPEALAFEDFICFSRITKLIAESICTIEKPSNDHWLSMFPFTEFKRLGNKPERMRNSIAGRLCTVYGMDAPTAQWIAQELYDSLA